MVTIKQDQAYERWDTLPDVLRDALYSEPNSDFIWKTCEAEHIPDEKIYGVARIAGYVLMGFLHPEDMAEELKESLSIDPKICASIASAINQRIFAPVRKDIDTVYAPPSRFAVGPKIIQDISPFMKVASAPAPLVMPKAPIIPTAPVPNVVSQTVANAAPKMTASPLAGNQTKVATPPPAPAKSATDGAGWSRSTADQPVVKLSPTSMPPPQNVAAPRITPVVKPAAIPISGPVGEFERISTQSGGGQKMSSSPVPPPPAAPAAPMPAPVMIHEDASFKPAQQPPNFHLQLPNQSNDILKGAAAGQVPLKPAVLELGKQAPTAPAPSGAMTTRVVHYSEYKSPSPEAPITAAAAPVNSGPRQITELTSAPKPLPPTPPMPSAPPTMRPPMPPAPPSPGTPPQNNTKVIVKDYGSE